jgi:hypothetical protein
MMVMSPQVWFEEEEEEGEEEGEEEEWGRDCMSERKVDLLDADTLPNVAM